MVAAPTRRSQKRIGLFRGPRYARRVAAGLLDAGASCRSSRSPTPCGVGLHRQADWSGINVDGGRGGSWAGQAERQRGDRLPSVICSRRVRPPRRAPPPRDDEHLLEVINTQIRSIPGIRSTENIRLPPARENRPTPGEPDDDHDARHAHRPPRTATCWMHFTPMTDRSQRGRPGSSCAVKAPVGSYDQHGKRYPRRPSAGFVRVAGRSRAAPSSPMPAAEQARKSSRTSRCGATRHPRPAIEARRAPRPARAG